MQSKITRRAVLAGAPAVAAVAALPAIPALAAPDPIVALGRQWQAAAILALALFFGGCGVAVL